jgi:hypothetical protein
VVHDRYNVVHLAGHRVPPLRENVTILRYGGRHVAKRDTQNRAIAFEMLQGLGRS